MTTGIYRLLFNDGSFYIGQSVNIENRIDQHIKDMIDGKHTRKLQDAYEKCGIPSASIMTTCHKDHLDYLEGYYIISLLPGLNTSIPKGIDVDHIDKLLGTGYFNLSSLELMDKLKQEDGNLEIIQGFLEEQKESEEAIVDRLMPGMLDELKALRDQARILHIAIDQLNAELRAAKLFKKEPWYKNLF